MKTEDLFAEGVGSVHDLDESHKMRRNGEKLSRVTICLSLYVCDSVSLCFCVSRLLMLLLLLPSQTCRTIVSIIPLWQEEIYNNYNNYWATHLIIKIFHMLRGAES